jgi:3-(3-hydroxy-phenyl)propionate hydroxylase
MRVGETRYRWEFRLGEGQETVRELVAPWLPPSYDGDFEVVRETQYTFRARVADRWRSGRVFLLGDAAHLTPPFIGQGLCSGLRDAYNLTWKLARVLQQGGDERLLDTYESERKPHARHVIRLAVAMGWAMTGGQDRAAALRRFLFARMVRFPRMKTAMLRSVAPRLRRGPLVAGPALSPRRRGLAGTLMPQPLLTVDGTGQRLDDLVGPGFAIVTRDPLSPALDRLATALNAAVVHAGTDHTEVRRPDGSRSTGHEDVLVTWLRHAGASAAVIRPDRTVLTAITRTKRVGSPSTPSWPALIPTSPQKANS